MQVAKRNNKHVATCKSGAHPEEHTACCKIVCDVWRENSTLVPVTERTIRGQEAVVELHDRQPVEPAPFWIPADIPADYVKDPDFVDRHGIDRHNSNIVLKPLSQGYDDSTLVTDRSVTVWGPWCSRTVELRKSQDGQHEVSGEEYGLFPVDTRNFVEMWILYEWWSLTWRGGTRLHCLFEHMTAKYSIASAQKFMNKRLWYAACYKFVSSLDFMRLTVDKKYDWCDICQNMTPFSICMDGCVLSCDKRKLHPEVLTAESTHADEFGVENADHCICFPDAEADILQGDEARDTSLDHTLPLSILSRCFQQHLSGDDGSRLNEFTRNPFSPAQKATMQKLGNWAKSFAKHNRLPALTSGDMESLCVPPTVHDVEVGGRRGVFGVCGDACWACGRPGRRPERSQRWPGRSRRWRGTSRRLQEGSRRWHWTSRTHHRCEAVEVLCRGN